MLLRATPSSAHCRLTDSPASGARSTNGCTCAQRPTASNRSAALASSSTGIICAVRIRRSAGEHRTRLISANRRRRRHWPPDAMPRRCREFVDSRLRRSPPDRASAVPYGQAEENATRFPHLAHRSAAAHKLHSTPQQDRMNLISEKVKPAAGYLPLAYSSPEPVQTPGTVAVLPLRQRLPGHRGPRGGSRPATSPGRGGAPGRGMDPRGYRDRSHAWERSPQVVAVAPLGSVARVERARGDAGRTETVHLLPVLRRSPGRLPDDVERGVALLDVDGVKRVRYAKGFTAPAEWA